MIRIRCTCGADRHELRITGHAGYAPPGQDIVCAGVSAIACGLAAHLRETQPRSRVRLCPGVLQAQCPRSAASDAAFAAAMAGLQIIARTYPQCVEVDTSPSGKGEEKERET